MKKVSIGLVAMLAVIFAVSSAFTSSHLTVKKLWVNALTVASPSATDFTEYLLGEEQAQVECVNPEEAPICIAKYEEDQFAPGQPESSLTVQDGFIIFGDYQPE